MEIQKDSLITKVSRFAHKAHDGQVRKYTGDSYIHHPLKVAYLVWRETFDENMIAAALLHDVVEDTIVTIEDISKNFGSYIASLVDDLTDISKPSDGNREVRKTIDRQHTAKASNEAKTIKLADLIDNSVSIIKNDPKFAKVYMREKKLLLEVLVGGNKQLYKEASSIINEYYREKLICFIRKHKK